MVQHEFRLLEAAVAVAEELNFSRASHRLRITQPALTKRIADLENRFTLTLFERDSKAVVLTDAGRAFIEHARLSLLHSERAVQSARAALANAETVLRVGRTPYGNPFFLSTLLALRLPLFPRLRVEPVSGYSGELVQGLLSGDLDLAIVTDPAESQALSMMRAAEEPFYVALSEEHPLANCLELQLRDLDGCPWIVFTRKTQPVMYEGLLRLAHEQDIHPTYLQEVLTPEEAYPTVIDQRGFAILTMSAALRIGRDGVTIRPLAE